MTVRKVADIFTALGSKIHFSREPTEEYGNYASRISWTIPHYIAESAGGLGEDKVLKFPSCCLQLFGCGRLRICCTDDKDKIQYDDRGIGKDGDGGCRGGKSSG